MVKIVLWFLKRKNLSKKDKSLLITAILTKFDALPLRDNISITSGRLEINGRPLDVEQAIRLRESAIQALGNEVEKLVEEHVLYTSIVTGVHKGTSDDSLLFSRAAIWWQQQRRTLLESLAHGDPDTLQD